MSVIIIKLISLKRFDFDIANVTCDNYLFLTVTFNCILWFALLCFAFESQIYSCALVKRSCETNSKATHSRVFNAYVTLRRQAKTAQKKYGAEAEREEKIRANQLRCLLVLYGCRCACRQTKIRRFELCRIFVSFSSSLSSNNNTSKTYANTIFDADIDHASVCRADF